MLSKNKLKIIINLIKNNILYKLEKNNIEETISQISTCARILYLTNQIYYEQFLENKLIEISNKLNLKTNSYLPKSNSIMFYDSFGLDNRGLAQIYLKAISNVGNIIYITYGQNKNRIPILESILAKNGNNKVYFLDGKNNLDKIWELKQIFEKERPLHIIYYCTPWEVILPIVSYSFKDYTKKYLINLTDHAFWLGSKFIDYSIEFRDYGAYITNKFRNINREKIVCLPYYPIIDEKKEFEGFPFSYDEKTQKIIFSGGNIYKTISEDNLYYKVVDNILSNHSEVIFWYAGSGDNRLYEKFNMLKAKFPKRLYITSERKDLFQVLQKCYFYFNTYPYGGALMIQYAVKAKKIPITLRFDNSINGLLINQDLLEVIFDNYDGLIEEINKLISDKDYLERKKLKVENSVISEKDFQEQLYLLLKTGKTKYNLNYKHIDTEEFRNLYMHRLNYGDVCMEISANSSFIYSLPLQYLIGYYYRAKYFFKKLCSHINFFRNTNNI